MSRWIVAHVGLATILVATGLAAGCSKSKSPEVQLAAEQTTNQVAADQSPVYQQPSAAAPATATAQSPAEPDLKELNRSLLRWIIGNHRRPKSFEDFAATSGVVIPPPPAGKKYVLGKGMHILLVDR
ncbi:MAG: hypothetical protein WDM80_14290 [Limisphaerales bacterium]